MDDAVDGNDGHRIYLEAETELQLQNLDRGSSHLGLDHHRMVRGHLMASQLHPLAVGGVGLARLDRRSHPGVVLPRSGHERADADVEHVGHRTSHLRFCDCRAGEREVVHLELLFGE
ncbi:MAG: hypothetical protein AAF467_12180 [Actinomycetota bacterium]